MKIAILSPFYPFRGGLAQLNALLYNQLSKQNEVKAFTFTTLYPEILFPGKTQFVSADDSATPIDSKRVLSSINPFSYISTARQINEYLPNLLIVPYWMSFLAPAFGSVCKLLNKTIKVVSLVHNAIGHEQHFFDKAFANYFFRSCDAFIVMSEPVKKDLEQLVSNKPILLAPHPIYDHYKEKIPKSAAALLLNVDATKNTLLFFGLIRDYKGLDILISAMDYLDVSYQLIIAGESYGDFSKYQNLIDSSPLKTNIKVLEQYIPDDMVTTLFSASDLLVLPYRSATQSGVVALAYQMETPMVATPVGALGDTVRLSGTGIVVDQISPENIAKSIKLFFEDNNKEHYFTNLKVEKQRLSWSSFTQSLELFFRSIL